MHEFHLLASFERMEQRPFPPPDEGTAVIFAPRAAPEPQAEPQPALAPSPCPAATPEPEQAVGATARSRAASGGVRGRFRSDGLPVRAGACAAAGDADAAEFRLDASGAGPRNATRNTTRNATEAQPEAHLEPLHETQPEARLEPQQLQHEPQAQAPQAATAAEAEPTAEAEPAAAAAPHDPLHALKAMSPEEQIALFS